MREGKSLGSLTQNLKGNNMSEKKIARVTYSVLPSAMQKADNVDYAPLLAVAADLLAVDASQKVKAKNGVVDAVLSLAQGQGKSRGCAIMLDSLLNLTGSSIESATRSFASRCGVKIQKDDTGRYCAVEWKQPLKDGVPVPMESLETYLRDLPWKKESDTKDKTVETIENNGAGLQKFMKEKKAYFKTQLKGRNDGNVARLFELMADDAAFCDKVLSLASDYKADANKGFFAKLFS